MPTRHAGGRGEVHETFPCVASLNSGVRDGGRRMARSIPVIVIEALLAGLFAGMAEAFVSASDTRQAVLRRPRADTASSVPTGSETRWQEDSGAAGGWTVPRCWTHPQDTELNPRLTGPPP
jgi:surface antigen